MKLDELHRCLRVRPFRSFTIQTVDAQSFLITSEQNLVLPAPKPEMVFAFVDGQMYTIDIDSSRITQ
jgi:hypothetical protein